MIIGSKFFCVESHLYTFRMRVSLSTCLFCFRANTHTWGLWLDMLDYGKYRECFSLLHLRLNLKSYASLYGMQVCEP